MSSLKTFGATMNHHTQQSFGENAVTHQANLSMADLVCTNNQSITHHEQIDYLDSQDKKDFDKLFKENYLAVCQLYNEFPVARLMKNIKYDYQSKYLKLENCNICEKSAKSVLYTLYSIIENLYGISFSQNPFFKDPCVKQLIEILPEYKTLQGLKLDKINISDHTMHKLIDSLPSLHLVELSLSGNPMSFFCFDSLSNVLKEKNLSLEWLDISNTKLTDKNGINLFEAILIHSKIKYLNLSRNSGLGYKFSAYSLHLAKNLQDYKLSILDVSYCGISQMHQKQLQKAITMNSFRQQSPIVQETVCSNKNPISLRKASIVHKSPSLIRKSSLIENSVYSQKGPGVEMINLTSSQDTSKSIPSEKKQRNKSQDTVNHFTPNENFKQRDTILSMSPISPIEQSIGNHLKNYNMIAKGQQNLFEQTTIHNIHHSSNEFQRKNSAPQTQKFQMSSYNQRRNDSKKKRTQQQQMKTFDLRDNSTHTFDERSVLSSLSNINNTQESDMNKASLFPPQRLAPKQILTSNPSYTDLNQQQQSSFQEYYPEKLKQPFVHKSMTSVNSQAELITQSQAKKQSPNRSASIYYNYQRNLRKQQKLASSTMTQSQQISMMHMNKPNESQSQSSSFITPQIIKSKSRLGNSSQHHHFSSNCSTDSKRQVSMNRKDLVIQHQKQLESLNTERYSQNMMKAKYKRNSSNECTYRQTQQGKTPTTRRSTSRNDYERSEKTTPQNVSFVNKFGSVNPQTLKQNSSVLGRNNQPKGNLQNLTQVKQIKNQIKSYKSTRPTSNQETKRIEQRGSASKDKRDKHNKENMLTNDQVFNSINDVSQLKEVIKNEIERLQCIYQSIDTVVMQQTINPNQSQHTMIMNNKCPTSISAFSTVSFKKLT